MTFLLHACSVDVLHALAVFSSLGALDGLVGQQALDGLACRTVVGISECRGELVGAELIGQLLEAHLEPGGATTECGGILQLLKSDYIKMVNSDKVFLFNILNYLSSGSQRSTSLALAVHDGTVAERLATLLDTLVLPGATDVVLTFKQKDLCNLLGTQRTTLVITLNRLIDEDIIECDSSRMRILDQSKLFELIRNR